MILEIPGRAGNDKTHSCNLTALLPTVYFLLSSMYGSSPSGQG